jgi:RNA polymerase sigma-70 factor (ECF subfamily)
MGTCVITSAKAVGEASQTIPDAISMAVSRAQDGDREAFATLFELHKKKVYSICLRMTGNVAEAEDLTQDAFMQAFRKLATFRGDSLFSTWLYRIAVNTVLMTLRRKRFRQVSLDEPIPMDSSGAQRELRHDDLDLLGAVDRIALASALRELPPGCRMIFLLHEVQGYEHHEIAKLLRCSVGNSKSQLHKARWKMRAVLFPGHESV